MSITSQLHSQSRRSRGAALLFVYALVGTAALGLGACGANKSKDVGQTLVKVNGDEITVLQLNEELGHSQAQAVASGQAAVSKQVLDGLVDRQLLEHEALASKLDRDPKVMQAIERAKSQILAQAYLQSRVSKIGKPSKTEVDDYFQKHPEYFSQRKLFGMHQLVVATKDFSEPLRAELDSAKSLDEVAAWLDVNKVRYMRGEITRSTADLPPPMVAKLQSMQKGQLFVIKENERTLLVGLDDIKNSPVSADDATPQIEQYLRNQKSQDAAKQELARLRTTAKIEYTNKADGDKGKALSEARTAPATATTIPTAAVAPQAIATDSAANETSSATPASVVSKQGSAPNAPNVGVVPSAGDLARGVAGLK